MITLTFEWHLIILIAIIVALIIWCFTLSDEESMLGSQRQWGCFSSIVVVIIVIAIYGGIFWW